MAQVPLGLQAYDRTFGDEPEIEVLNRFFEKNPTNLVEKFSLLSRPGTTHFLSVGSGKVRKMATQPGVFEDDLFIVVGQELWRYDRSTLTQIQGAVLGAGQPSITIVAGPGYEHLFIADSLTLQYYDGEDAATNTLTTGGTILATETVNVNTVWYEWTAGDVDAGAPDGSESDPWLVDLGADAEESLLNLSLAINATGTPGTTYSTAITVAHANVEAPLVTATTLFVRALTRGTIGNAYVATETGADLVWAGATFAGGGAHTLHGVTTPDDVGVLSLTNLASFVIASITDSQRFYWIQPGALIIDALDFATAESEPDQIVDMLRVGDAVYMFGQSSTEVWYATGAQDAPFLRQQGLAFSQGAREGTPVQIRTQVVTIAEDGKVYQVAGGPKRLSQNGIEERIRLAYRAEEDA